MWFCLASNEDKAMFSFAGLLAVLQAARCLSPSVEMQSAVVQTHGGADRISVQQLAAPTPGPKQGSMWHLLE